MLDEEFFDRDLDRAADSEFGKEISQDCRVAHIESDVDSDEIGAAWPGHNYWSFGSKKRPSFPHDFIIVLHSNQPIVRIVEQKEIWP